MGLLVCLTVWTYATSLRGGYVYEDAIDPGITAAPWPGLRGVAAQMRATPARSLNRAITAITHHYIDTRPITQRTMSLLLHLVNGLLLYVLARTVMSEAGALVAMGVWLLHPLMTESVAYMSARPELVAGAWTLSALVAASKGWNALALACAALAITGKEIDLTALGLVPLFVWCIGAPRWSVRAIGDWVAVSAAMVWLFLQGADARMALWVSWTYVAAQLTAFGRLVLLLLEAIVHPAALTIDHDWMWITRPIAYGGAMLWVIALALAWRWPLWRFAVLGSLVALVPRLVLPLPDGLHERHLVLPMIGWTLACGSLCGRKETA